MPPSLRHLGHTHLAIGVAPYRISSFRFVNPRKCNNPGCAGLDAEFRKINFRCDVAITEAFADQAIAWAQHSHFSQKTRVRLTSRIRFFERNRGALDQRFVSSARTVADSRGLWRTFRFELRSQS